MLMMVKMIVDNINDDGRRFIGDGYDDYNCDKWRFLFVIYDDIDDDDFDVFDDNDGDDDVAVNNIGMMVMIAINLLITILLIFNLWCDHYLHIFHFSVIARHIYICKSLSSYHASHTSYSTCVCMYDGWCIYLYHIVEFTIIITFIIIITFLILSLHY